MLKEGACLLVFLTRESDFEWFFKASIVFLYDLKRALGRNFASSNNRTGIILLRNGILLHKIVLTYYEKKLF